MGQRSRTTRASLYSRLVWLLIAGLALAADQVTKFMVGKSISEHRVVPVIPHFLDLIYTRNAGVAFGIFSDSPAPWKTGLLIVVDAALLAFVLALLLRNQRVPWRTGVALALILGGALSNLLDRIRFGQVVDFLDVYYSSYHWPTFNVADSCIVVGSLLLAFQLLFLESP